MLAPLAVIPPVALSVSGITDSTHSIEAHHYVYKQTLKEEKTVRRGKYKMSRYLKVAKNTKRRERPVARRRLEA